MFVFLVVFVFVILVDRRPSLFGFETGGFNFCLWLLLSKTAVFAFLMGNGFGTLGTDLNLFVPTHTSPSVMLKAHLQLGLGPDNPGSS